MIGCGSGESPSEVVVPAPPTLNTATHTEPGATWSSTGLQLDQHQWRLISIEPGSSTQASAVLNFSNPTSSPIRFWWSVRFMDAAGFELDRYEPVQIYPEDLAPGESIRRTETFSLFNLKTIALANQVSKMEVWVAFPS